MIHKQYKLVYNIHFFEIRHKNHPLSSVRMGHKVYTKSLYYCGTQAQLRLRETKKATCHGVWASSGTDSEHEGLTAPGSESVYLANMLNYI